MVAHFIEKLIWCDVLERAREGAPASVISGVSSQVAVGKDIAGQADILICEIVSSEQKTCQKHFKMRFRG